ncbi:protein TESPA1 [Pogona vitticeps]
MPSLQAGLPRTLGALQRVGFSLAMDNENSWLNQASWERRHAWAKQGCTHHSTTAKAEGSPSGAQEVCDLQLPFLENGLFQETSSDKIESWLAECSSSADPFSESISGPAACGSCSNRTSFEDDLSLGAEAPLLLHKDRSESRFQKGTCWPSQPINLDHSMAYSAISGSTNKTSSSISEVLDLCEVDAETILYNLGFIQEETQDTSWIPPRFFLVPSQAEGIDFQAFLRAQVRRIEMEDPCLMLANRFKQVQNLAVTADAFFCLYSYVSKMPVQKISPTPLFWNLPETLHSWNLSSSPNSLSLIQRLQQAVSRMCLYTAPREGSPSGATGVLSPTRCLEKVVWEVMEKMLKERSLTEVGDMKDEAHTVPSGDLSKMANASSDSTAVAVAPETSSCLSHKPPSHSEETTDLIMPGPESWFSHCTGEAREDKTDHPGYPEHSHSPKAASSPDESSEEPDGEWSTEKVSTTEEEDYMDLP